MKFKDFSQKKIIVVGDILLDKYVWGSVSRMSPEAPVQIVDVEKENFVLGGAANTANNITTLGAKAILVGIVGNDEAAKVLNRLIEEKGIENSVISDGQKPTIQKIRVMAQNQQLLRIDYETKEDYP